MKFAFSGHIDLIADDKNIINRQLKQKLQELKHSHRLEEVVVGVAEGADQLCLACCKELEIPVSNLNDNVFRQQEETDSQYYERQCEYMVEHCEHFMVVWDGLFTEKAGGTSWLVQLLLQHRSKKIIHHLITPRQSNPYPVNYLSSRGLIPFGDQLDSKLPWLPCFFWTSFEIGNSNKVTHQLSGNRQYFKDSLFQKFIIPITLALITLVLGTIGFSVQKPISITYEGFGFVLDNFFKSIDFITLNGLHFTKGNFFLHVARFTGVLTPITAIAFGVYTATSVYRKKRKLKKWFKSSKSFVVVIGENPEANDLVKDLNHKGFHVLQLKTNQEDNSIIKINNNHLIESIYSDIDEIYYGEKISKAGLIYIMGDDESNLQNALRFETYSKGKKLDSVKNIFIHLRSDEKAKLLNNISNHLADKLKIFNIKHNTVRRLFNYFPIDQESKDISYYSIHIIDYNSLSQVLIEHLLSQIHLEKNIRIDLKIYSENPDLIEIEFFKTFNALKHKSKPDRVEYYNWSNWEIDFCHYSIEISSKQVFLETIELDLNLHKSVSLYVCIENSSVSSTWLSAYLPRLNQLKQETSEHLQVFSFYNSPNLQEEIQIERYYNKLAPHLFVTCFGNYLQECSFESINLDTLDKLAIEIADWYDKKYNPNASSAINNWSSTSYMDKKSNRHAADHIWIKWRWLLRNINNVSFDSMSSFELFRTLEKAQLNTLGEIEHRRWCANLALEGYTVLPEKYQPKWKKCKAKFKSQYLHRDLIPFEELKPEDQLKDEDQIEGIPYFIKTTY